MRDARLTAILLVAAVAAVAPLAGAAADRPVQFHSPANFEAAASVEGATWAVLFFVPGASQATVHARNGIDVTEHAYPAADVEDDGVGGLPDEGALAITSSASYANDVRLGFDAGGGYLSIQADALRFDSSGSAGKIAGPASLQDVRAQLPADVAEHNPFWTDYGGPAGPNAAVAPIGNRSGLSFHLVATGVRSATWFAAAPDCPAESCPRGGGWHARSVALPGGHAAAGTFDYEQATLSGDIEASGQVRMAILGGPSLAAAFHGTLRLPAATGTVDCGACAQINGQTLVASGNLTLSGLAYAPSQGSLDAVLGGDVSAARLDEQAVSASQVLGAAAAVAAVAAAGVGLGLLARLVATALFTRQREEELLDVPNRRLVHDAVVANPGIGFRELVRSTGLAIGTVRHHLTVLHRHGRIVEHVNGSSKAFFENHGKYDRDWQEVAVLRGRGLGALHEWIRLHPNASQKTMVEAMGARGWTRRATQHRLGKLVGQGLVVVAPSQGRLKLYTVCQE